MTNSADPDLIWIYTVCKGRAYLGSAGQGLRGFGEFGQGMVEGRLLLNLGMCFSGQQILSFKCSLLYEKSPIPRQQYSPSERIS